MSVHDGKTEVLESPPRQFPADGVIGLYDEEKDEYYEFDEYQIGGLPKRVLKLGRGRKCDVQVADSAVSFAHCTLTRDENGACVVEETESRNGIWVNDLRVSGPTRLFPGMWLTVGGSTLTVIGPHAIPVLAEGHTTFLAKSHGYHGSSYEAADQVGKSQATVWRASERHRKRQGLPRIKSRKR
jgi:hypothetical protein